MTNLEWLKTLSAEELADWFYDEWLHHLQYRWSSSRGGLIIWLKDRKTENSSEIPNNCEHITEDGVTCARYPACDDCFDNPLNKVKGSERFVKGSEQTETKMETKNSNLTFEKVMEEIQTQVIEFPDTHQKFTFARKIEMDGDSIKIGGWEYKGVKDGEREGE